MKAQNQPEEGKIPEVNHGNGAAKPKGKQKAKNGKSAETKAPFRIKKKLLRGAGFSDDEIAQVEQRCAAKLKKGKFSNEASLVNLGTAEDPQWCWVCKTIAQAIDKLRPGAWIRLPANVQAEFRRRAGVG